MIDPPTSQTRAAAPGGRRRIGPLTTFAVLWLLAFAAACSDPQELFTQAREAAAAGNHARAARLFEKSARGGEPRAQLAMGWLYFHGRGVERDPVETAEWWTRAAEAGLAEAQCRLGMLYRDGAGVERDPAAAVRWWREAAEQGDTMARFELGKALRDGFGTAADPEEAYVWMSLAAEPYHPMADAAREELEAELDADALARARERIAELSANEDDAP